MRRGVNYSRLAADTGVTEGAVRVVVHRLRGRYRELLRDEVRQTISDATQVEEEMRALFSAFAE